MSSIELQQIEYLRNAGFEVKQLEAERTILVPYTRQKEAEVNEHIQLLKNQFQYGVQLIIE